MAASGSGDGGGWGALLGPRLGQSWLQSAPGEEVAQFQRVSGGWWGGRALVLGWFSSLKFAPWRVQQSWVLLRGIVSRGHYQGLWMLPEELRED